MSKPKPSDPFGGINLTVPDGASKAGDLYGLGPWAGQQVSPGNLGFTITTNANQPTAADIVSAFAKTSDPSMIGMVQQALWLGGFYGSSQTPPTYGVLSNDDVKAFGKAVTLAGQSGQQVASVLTTGADVGASAGIAAARLQAQSHNQVAQVNLPNTENLEFTAKQVFQQELGRKATDAEAAAFAAAFRATSGGIQRSGNQAVFDAQQAAQNPTPPPTTDTQEIQDSQVGTPDWAARIGDYLNNYDSSQSPFVREMGNIGDQQDAVRQSLAQQQAPTLSQVNVEAPPDMQVAASDYARATHPQEAAVHDLGGQLAQFLNILRSHFGGM